MVATCQCGRVALTLVRAPDFINDCNCSLCRKVGAAWGYFSGADVTITGETAIYQRRENAAASTNKRSDKAAASTGKRREKAAGGVQVHACPACHAATHFEVVAADGARHVGVNMRLAAPQGLHGIELRFPDGAAWSGHGAYTHRRASFIISAQMPL